MSQTLYPLYEALQATADSVSVVSSAGPVFDVLHSIGIAVVIIQLFFVIRGQIVDHDRRRKQATIEFVGSVQPIFGDSHEELEELFGPDTITETFAHRIWTSDTFDEKDDPELEAAKKGKLVLRSYLNRIEHIAAGANTGVFDKDLLHRLSGNFLVRMWDRYSNFIKIVQKELGKKRYSEFETMVSDFRSWEQADSQGMTRPGSWVKRVLPFWKK